MESYLLVYSASGVRTRHGYLIMFVQRSRQIFISHKCVHSIANYFESFNNIKVIGIEKRRRVDSY